MKENTGGDSGFIPHPFDRAMELLERGVGDVGLRFLRAVGVRHVVAPESGRGQAGELLLEGLTAVADAGSRERVLEVTPGPAARVVEAAEPVCTRWAPAGIVLAFPEPSLSHRQGRTA